jgi:hypothetical protein
MRDTERGVEELVMRVAAIVGPLVVLLFAGCASVLPVARSEEPQSGALHGSVVAKSLADGRATPSTSGSTGNSTTQATPSGAKTLVNGPAPPTSASQLSKKESMASDPSKQKASPPLDLVTLETRLKATRAIGEFAKIVLRSQVDDLLSQFRAFHQGKLKTTLAELRRPYDLLVLKVLSLLQDNDPSLAAALVASREAIWAILADPLKFAAI